MSDRQLTAGSVVKVIGETAVVAAIVFGIGWGGMRLADARRRSPIPPDKDGAVRVAIRQSSWHGDVSLVEQQYTGAWHCEREWKVWWHVGLAATGPYRVIVQSGCPGDSAGGAFEVAVDDQVLTARAPNTGGWTRWKDTEIGQLKLNAGPHLLTVRSAGPAATQPASGPAGTSATAHMNLRMVTLRPA